MFTSDQLHYMQDNIFVSTDNFPPEDATMITSIQNEIATELA